MPNILQGAPSRVPGAPSRVPGSARLPQQIGGFLTRVPRQPTAGQFGRAHFQQVRDARGRFAGGWGFAWVGLESTAERIRDLNDHLHETVQEAAQSLADEMVEYARENAPWEDDPSNDTNARESLQAGVVWTDQEHFTIFLGHGADIYYGIWLEVRWGGKYAIIVPTIMAFAPQLGDRVRTMA